MEVILNRPQKINLKTMRIYIKCTDRFTCTVVADNEYQPYSYEGYVPSVVPGDYGDYLDLKIDIETGMILNWPKNNIEEWTEFLSQCK